MRNYTEDQAAGDFTPPYEFDTLISESDAHKLASLLYAVMTESLRLHGDGWYAVPPEVIKAIWDEVPGWFDNAPRCRICRDKGYEYVYREEICASVSLGPCDECNPEVADDAIDTRRPDYV